ncbi:Sel-1 protein (plasmid) [Legionella adelaidensis]|uniref:Type IV secretion system putative lipoprotein virB7 n=1 Tax=Legionella adelaidensis TaxID=45056 RepID=A0A0W0R3U8_9GAMM|nr:lipoprotein [Legionella adelaidensis]KTC65750.1 Sel-1 protein [Legionella adelaidensis]VEH85084.1 Sel-1 protein [Legionella adelaidensis]
MKKIILFLMALAIVSSCSYRNFTDGIRSFKVQNYRQAFILLKPEAEKGQPDAQYAVGYMYYYGYGVVEDRIKACYWIKRAAALGQPDAVQAVEILRLNT